MTVIFSSKAVSTLIGDVTKGDVTYLNTETELSAADFPNDTGLYAIHNSDANAFDGTAWSGGINGTAIGTFSQGTNHLGELAYTECTSGAIALAAASVPTGTDTNFSAGIKFRLDSGSGDIYLISKYTTTNADKSFDVRLTGNGIIVFEVYYNASGGVRTANSAAGYRKIIGDGKWHTLQICYQRIDAAKGHQCVFLDGNIIGYSKTTSATGRNDNGVADVVFGGYTANGHITGAISECYFHQGTNHTINEAMKIYARMCGHEATEDIYGNINLLDNRANLGSIIVMPTATQTLASSAAAVAGYRIYPWAEGTYLIEVGGTISTYDSGDTEQAAVVYIGIPSIGKVQGSSKRIYLQASSNSDTIAVPFDIQCETILNVDDQVDLYGYNQLGGTSSTIYYHSGESNPYIKLTRLK